ncbi:MAG: phosphotransferase family protein [Myxococcota bacterium]
MPESPAEKPGFENDENEALRAPFEAWLAKRWPDAEALSVGTFEAPKSGFSAKTVFVPLQYRRGGELVEEKVVLRIENPEPAIYPQQAPGLDVEIDLQYRAMAALEATGKVPLAGLIGYEADPSVLGQPFFAMGFVEGQVMTESPPYVEEGFFFDASPAAREKIVRGGVEMMARFHSIDWQDAGFEWLVHPEHAPNVERQIDLWADYGHRELGDRPHPDFEIAVDWLRANLPSDLKPALSWGDSRPGNIIYGADGEILCITDFENMAIAPNEIDVGWWMLFDRTMHESLGQERLPGDLSRQAQREIYAEAAGIPVPDTYYYEVLGGMRYAAIVVRVMNRLVARGVMPEDHTIWRDNPAAVALTQLLDKGGLR